MFLPQQSPGHSGDKFYVWNHFTTSDVVILLCMMFYIGFPMRVLAYLHQEYILIPWEKLLMQSEHWEKVFSNHTSDWAFMSIWCCFSHHCDWIPKRSLREITILAHSFRHSVCHMAEWASHLMVAIEQRLWDRCEGEGGRAEDTGCNLQGDGCPKWPVSFSEDPSSESFNNLWK